MGFEPLHSRSGCHIIKNSFYLYEKFINMSAFRHLVDGSVAEVLQLGIRYIRWSQ